MFRDIVGQERVLAFLRRALALGQVPPALMFVGGEGVGKATVARALAQALNCQEPTPDQDACGHCPNCRLFAEGTFPDYWEITPAGEGLHPQIRIDQIRELRRQVNLPPLAGSWRVVLLKPAEAMTVEAANAFLKTLEEVPAANILILAATAETDLLPTIVSRCHRLSFVAIPSGLVIATLSRRRQLPPAQAAFVAGFHPGSLGRALQEDPETLLADRNQVVAELQELEEATLGAMLDWAARRAKQKEDLERFTYLARLWYRDLLALAHGATADQLINRDRLADLQAQQQRLTPQEILGRLAALNLLQQQLRANFNVELCLNAFSQHWRRPTALLVA